MKSTIDVESTMKRAEEIRLELFKRKIKRTDLVPLLAQRGVIAAANQISEAVNCSGFAPRYQKILQGIEEILKEKEEEEKNER